MDLIIYDKNTKEIFLVLTDVKLSASSAICESKYKLEYVHRYQKYIKELPNGKIAFKRPIEKKKSNIIYLDDYRKPY